MDIRVQDDPFDPGAEISNLVAGRRDMGGLVTFTGMVRDSESTPLDRMEIEHYPGMTERAIETIVIEARKRWSLGHVLVIHRYGKLAPGEAIMMVATLSRHRADAFAAAEFLMDYLKSRAPFWKKEVTADGSGWVAARDEDETALCRW